MIPCRVSGFSAATLFSVLLLCQTACSPPAGTGGGGGDGDGTPAPRSFSGVLYDAVSGAPIAGAEVNLGWDTETTGSGGAFEFALSGPYTVRSEAFCVAAADHAFLYVETLDVDTSVNTSLSLPLRRLEPSSYTDTIAVGGVVYHAPGVPIEQGGVRVSIYGANGTFEEFDEIRYEDAGAYTVHTSVRSANSLVVVEVRDAVSGGGARADFVFYRAGVDLATAGAGPLIVDAARPSATDYEAIRILGGSAGDTARAYFRSDYGQVPCRFLPMTPAGAPNIAADILGTLELESTAAHEVVLYNPAGWSSVVLVHGREDVGAPAGHGRHWLAASSPQRTGGDLTLMAIDDTLGPFSYPDLDSLHYEDGTLALDPVTGADLYVHRLEEEAADGPIGVVIARSAGVQLPGVLLARLGGVVMTDSCQIRDLCSPSLSPTFLESRDVPALLRLGEVYGIDPRYERSVNVPPGGTITIGLE